MEIAWKICRKRKKMEGESMMSGFFHVSEKKKKEKGKRQGDVRVRGYDMSSDCDAHKQ